MMDLTALIEFIAPGSAARVSRAPGGVEGDPWPGIDGWTAADYQNALDTLVEWAAPAPTGAAVHGNIDAYLASLPTRAELDATRKDRDAAAALGQPETAAILDAMWDMEVRLRAAGQASAEPDIASAATREDYDAVMGDRLKGLMLIKTRA